MTTEFIPKIKFLENELINILENIKKPLLNYYGKIYNKKFKGKIFYQGPNFIEELIDESLQEFLDNQRSYPGEEAFPIFGKYKGSMFYMYKEKSFPKHSITVKTHSAVKDIINDKLLKSQENLIGLRRLIHPTKISGSLENIWSNLPDDAISIIASNLIRGNSKKRKKTRKQKKRKTQKKSKNRKSK